MSQKTIDALIQGLEKMLENRGSMTVKEVELLTETIDYLKRHRQLSGKDRSRNAEMIISLLLRFLLDPTISKHIVHVVKEFIDKLS